MALKRELVPWDGSGMVFLRFRCWLKSPVNLFMLMLAFEVWSGSCF